MTIPPPPVAPHSTKLSAKASPAGTNGTVEPGVSIRFGPVQDKDVDMEDADAHGVSKRKSRASIDNKKTYAEPESSDEDDQPLVRSAIVAN
jgi:DNA topoisomerase-1